MEIYCRCACGDEFKAEGDELALNGRPVIEVQYDYWEKQHSKCKARVYEDVLLLIQNLVQWNRPAVDGFTLAHEIQEALRLAGFECGP